MCTVLCIVCTTVTSDTVNRNFFPELKNIFPVVLLQSRACFGQILSLEFSAPILSSVFDSQPLYHKPRKDGSKILPPDALESPLQVQVPDCFGNFWFGDADRMNPEARRHLGEVCLKKTIILKFVTVYSRSQTS